MVFFDLIQMRLKILSYHKETENLMDNVPYTIHIACFIYL